MEKERHGRLSVRVFFLLEAVGERKGFSSDLATRFRQRDSGWSLGGIPAGRGE